MSATMHRHTSRTRLLLLTLCGVILVISFALSASHPAAVTHRAHAQVRAVVVGTATQTPAASKYCSEPDPYTNTNMAGCDLAGQDFHGQSLYYMDFRNADLSGANFTGADLHGSDFGGADLTRTNFTGANLSYAVMIGADLRTANLGTSSTYANFNSTDLRNANLEGVDTYAQLWYTKLQGANLRWGTFRSLFVIDVTSADLTNATLQFTDVRDFNTWSNTICPDGSNSDANGNSCFLHLAIQQTRTPSPVGTPSQTYTRTVTKTPTITSTPTMSKTPTNTTTPVASTDCTVRAQNSIYVGCDLSGQDMHGLNLKGSDFRYANLTDTNLAGALLHNTQWGGATLTRTNFKAAELKSAAMAGVDLRSAILGTSYPATEFVYTDLRNANLSGLVTSAVFWQSNMSGATIQNSILANVNGANMTDANLYNTTFTQPWFMFGFTWSNTVCPNGTNSDALNGLCYGARAPAQTYTPSLTVSPSQTYTRTPTPSPTPTYTPSTTPTPVASSDCSARTQNSNLAGCDLSGLNLSGLNLNGTDFRNAILTDTNFTNTLLWNTNFGGATLTRTNLTNAEIVDATMMGVDLRTAVFGTVWPGAQFNRVNMRNVDLRGQSGFGYFGYVDFTGANLQNTSIGYIRYTNLTDADTTNAVFPSDTLFSTLTWSRTICPDGSSSTAHDETCTGYTSLSTATSTHTATVTPSKTYTPSDTRTATPLASATRTPSKTPIPSLTKSPTRTLSPTKSKTPTRTSTKSPTRTKTRTPTKRK